MLQGTNPAINLHKLLVDKRLLGIVPLPLGSLKCKRKVCPRYKDVCDSMSQQSKLIPKS